MHQRPAVIDVTPHNTPAMDRRERRAHVRLACPGSQDVVGEVDVNEASSSCGTLLRYLDPPAAVALNDHLRVPAWPPAAAMPAMEPDQVVGDVGIHPGHRTLVVGAWGPAARVAEGLTADGLQRGAYGHSVHMHDLDSGHLVQTLDLGASHQVVASVCPARQPSRAYGFAATMTSNADLSATVWLWHRTGDANGRCVWTARKVIGIPAEPSAGVDLPAAFVAYGAVPPLVSHVALSPDDRMLYVCCWGTGELRQYDVCDPFHPVLSGLVRLGGMARRQSHPKRPRHALRGGPASTALSRDGRRLYVTSALHPAWDDSCHPGGVDGWLAKCHADPNGGLALDPCFLVAFDDHRPHRVVLDAVHDQAPQDS
jgi:methanethiol oxidase